MKQHLRKAFIALPLIFALASPTLAAEFPSKPLRLLVGYAPASGADVVARLIAESLQHTLKQSVIVENKTGAGGILAAQETARAAPDGYTLMLAAMPQMTILPKISKVSYDPEKDFVAISQIVDTDLVLVVNPERVPAESMQTFVDWSKKQDSLFFGTPGTGSVGHFGAYFFSNSVGVAVEPIHFRTTGEQVSALVNGDIQAEFFSSAAALPLVNAGRLKALLSTSPTRTAMFPDIPTSTEAGYPGMQFSSWYGVLAPADTPPDIVEKLSASLVKATNAPATRRKLEAAGLRVTAAPHIEFAQAMKADINRWSQAVTAAGLQFKE